jgi:tight adherence protein B
MVSAFQAAAVVALAVFMTCVGLYNLVRALQAREQLIARAEDLAADPQVLSDPLRRQSFLVRWADRYDRSQAAAAIRERLRRACLNLKPSDYRVLRIGLAAGLIYVCVILLKISLLPSVALGLAVFFLGPRILFRIRNDAYVKKFNEQLIEVTQSLANALRAGMSIQQAINQAAERAPEPAQSEIRQTHNELLLGDNLSFALNSLRARIRSRELDVVVNAILVQHQAGGNLARVLSAMSNILTERRRLMGEIHSMTAEARFSAIIVQLMPIVLLIVLRNTAFGRGLFETTLGWVFLGIYGLVQIGIFFLIRRIMKIEV